MRRSITAACLAIAAAPAAATTLTIDIPDADVMTETVAYTCGGSAMSVDYINAGAMSLAVLRVAKETVIASNVISASGAKYAGAQYVWWTKGDEGFLQDLRKGADAEPTSCRRTD